MRFQVIGLIACAAITSARYLHSYSTSPSNDSLQSSGSSSQPFYNYSRSELSGNFSKYRCMDTSRLISMLPTCLYGCQIKANKADGCAYDDMTCHCANYDTFSKLVEPCAFPPALNGTSTCTMADLSLARPIISEMCTFLNATSYRSYRGCPQELSRGKTLALLALEKENRNFTRNGTDADPLPVNKTLVDNTVTEKGQTGCEG
ncbi:hypothetical protein BDU57DRAFT_569803 [Ampelomyces quisqualis]|uniref:CFEM domain-containing protein n=1 Tax=Ampelomyces quisqualis TaxID=50730 RepID=A0A6A5QY62_AMPQU|nr:hypothetical protein BDU57DRAFT_569803 [Ampelomyces quisqualis]